MPPAAFRPCRHGFRFGNRFDVPLAAPLLKAAGLPATWGFCGGMVHLAKEAFESGATLPRQEAPPAPGTPLYRRLVLRQLASLGPPPLFPEVWRFARWTRRSDAALAACTPPHLERARRLLERGQLVPLGLVYVRRLTRLWENHQVLAFAPGAEHTLRIYDPNEPGRDDVVLARTDAPGGPLLEKRRDGAPVRLVRGAFVMHSRESSHVA